MNSKPTVTAPLHPILVLALLALLGLVGCSREPRNLSLLDAPAAAAPTRVEEEDEEERRRLEEMQLVQAKDVTTGEFFSMTADELWDSIRPVSGWLLGGPCSRDIVCPISSITAQYCGYDACVATVEMCLARYMQSIALIRAEPVTLETRAGVSGTFTVSAQSAPTRAAILRRAINAVEQQRLFLSYFTWCGSSSGGYPSEPIPDYPTTSFGPAAGTLNVEALADASRLAEELTFDAIDAIVAAGDAQRSETLEVQQGAARAIAGAQLSRAEAAHLLIGGAPGLMGSTSQAFCSTPELSGRARRALALIRRAAPSPVVVKSTSTVPTDTFLNGTLAALPSGSVAVRLAFLGGLCTGNPATCPVTPIQQQTGISSEDFVQARNYLIQEIDAFARSTSSSAIFTPTRIGTAAQPAGVAFYASTRNEPLPPPPEYYAALIRYMQPGWMPPFGSVAPDLATNVSQVMTNIRTNSALLINRAKTEITFPNQSLSFPDQWKLIDGALSGLLSDDPRRGVFERSLSGVGTTSFKVHGFATTDRLRIVRGMDGLMCATTGTIEGAPCTDLTPHSVSELLTTMTPSYQLANAAGATVTLNDSTTPLFLVRPRNVAELVPGGYEYLFGFVVMNTTPNMTYPYAMVPELDRKAGELLRPSQSYCTRSAVECDGTLFDERLPLENELSDDGDGVESSWKHYLALADQAASEAHALGEQYITNGLEVDRQAEAAELRKIADQQRFVSQAESELEVVQDTCGTAMSTDELLNVLGVNLTGFSANKSSCAVANDCCAPGPPPCVHSSCVSNVCQPTPCSRDTQCCTGGGSCEFKCVSNKCARTVEGILSTPTSVEGLSRLQECIGDGTVVPAAVLGTDPVCYWTQTGNSNNICYNQSEQYPCPSPPRLDGTGHATCSGIPVPAGVTPPMLLTDYTFRGSPVDVKLGLIQSGKGYLAADPCVDLRKLRSNPSWASRQEMCTRIRPPDLTNAGFIGFYDTDDANVVDTLKAIAFFSETVGMRVDVWQDSRVRWGTRGGGLGAWPCGDHPFATPAECAQTPNALFCQKVNCSATTLPAELQKIAALNQRLLEATVLLKGRSRVDYENVWVPAALGAQLEPYSPAQALSNVNFSTYRLTTFSSLSPTVPQYQDNVIKNFYAYNPNGMTGTLPVFYKFYPAGSSTPTDYLIASGGYRALVPLPTYPWAFPRLTSLRDTTIVCGDTPSSQLEGFEWQRFKVDNFPPNPVLLPRGNGVASSQQTLDARLAPDLPYLTTRFRYDDQGAADAAELLCEAERGVLNTTQAGATCTLDPGTLLVASDFGRVRDYANCRVADFERSLGSLLLPRIPVRIIQGLYDTSEGHFPAIGGQMGAQMHRLRAALIRFGELNVAMRDAASQLRDTVDDMVVSTEMVRVRTDQERIDAQNANLRGTEARIRINQIDFQQQAAWTKAALDCGSGFLHGIAGAATSFGASVVAGAGDCVNSLVSADLEVQNLNYERQIAEVEQTIAQNDERREDLDGEYVQLEHARDLVRQRGQIRTIAGNMANLTSEARTSLEEISASLAELESLRLKALRSISRATQYQSTQAAVTRSIDTVLNAKLDVSKRRYQQAHENAIRLSFLAKRAIEQRLGVHLSELRADLPLVEAPSSWESTICTAEGVDYNAIRNPDGTAESRNFQGAFIGDYVRNLRNVVESYRLEFDFQEGTDVVVASVRDDVFGTRQFCAKSLGNKLTYSGTLNNLTTDATKPGWLIQGCPTGANGVDSTCLDIALDTTSPLDQAIGGAAPGYKLTWGTAANLSEKLAQQVRLTKGRYRVSWFTKEGTGSPQPLVQIDAGLFTSANVAMLATIGANAFSRWSAPAANGWTRHYRIFDITTDDLYWLKVVSSQLVSRAGSVAGVMLEPLSGADALEDASKLRVAPYIATQSDTTRMIQACQDSDGSAFRGQAWTRRCERLCRDGFSGTCEHSDRVSSCYWETTIGIDQRDLEEGKLFKQAGFAAGNFNYRFEEVAVNFVGTGVRDCTDAENPSSCYAGGFVPYSLKHIGPFFVRNHEGADFNVKLFTGNIEHARGLGMERYLTNPLSSTDRELLTPYVRTEFQGRPLDGSLLLRVWEEPGIDFNAIQDVQLYIKYRYWTRSQ